MQTERDEKRQTDKERDIRQAEWCWDEMKKEGFGCAEAYQPDDYCVKNFLHVSLSISMPKTWFHFINIVSRPFLRNSNSIQCNYSKINKSDDLWIFIIQEATFKSVFWATEIIYGLLSRTTNQPSQWAILNENSHKDNERMKWISNTKNYFPNILCCHFLSIQIH